MVYGTGLTARWRTCSRDECCGPGFLIATLTVAARQRLFTEPGLVARFTRLMLGNCEARGCRVVVYCFMPDHVHAVVEGLRPQADAWLGLVKFKRDSGVWLREQGRDLRWQRGFDVRLLDSPEDVEAACAYVVNNPVVGGLVDDWRAWPFTGEDSEVAGPRRTRRATPRP